MKKANLIWIILFISICLTMEWYSVLLWTAFILLSSSINLTIHELAHFFIGKIKKISTNVIPLGLISIYKSNNKWKVKLKSEYKNFYIRTVKGVNHNIIKNEYEYEEVRKRWSIIALSGPVVNFITSIISFLVLVLTYKINLYYINSFIISIAITSLALGIYTMLTSDGKAYIGMKKSDEYSAYVIFNNEMHFGEYESKKNSYMIKKIYYISEKFSEKRDTANKKIINVDLNMITNINYCILYNYLAGLLMTLPKGFQDYINYISINRNMLVENAKTKLSTYKFLYLLIIYWIALERKQEESLELLIFLEKLNIPRDDEVKYYRALIEEALGIRDNRKYLIEISKECEKNKDNITNVIEMKIKDRVFKLENDVVITSL